MQIIMTNTVLSHFTLAAATTTTLIEVDPGTDLIADVLVESVNGAPSAASLACKFQVGMIVHDGLNIGAETFSKQIPWVDVVASDGFTGHGLLDGAWPTSLADQTLAADRLISRRYRATAIGRLIRLVLTPSFTGGTSPNFRVTVSYAHAVPAVR